MDKVGPELDQVNKGIDAMIDDDLKKSRKQYF